jgi:hypothetical protein
MSSPRTVPPIGPAIIGKKQYEALKTGLEARHRGTAGNAVPIGSSITGGASTAGKVPGTTQTQAQALAEGVKPVAQEPEGTLSYNEAISLIAKHPEELETVVGLELKRPGGPRKGVLIPALKKARELEKAELVERLEQLVG